MNVCLAKVPAAFMNDDSLGAGLQMALFDVVGKILEVPVYQLLGNPCREAVPISWWCIDASPENWAAEAADAVKNGYTSFKNKPPALVGYCRTGSGSHSSCASRFQARSGPKQFLA